MSSRLLRLALAAYRGRVRHRAKGREETSARDRPAEAGGTPAAHQRALASDGRRSCASNSGRNGVGSPFDAERTPACVTRGSQEGRARRENSWAANDGTLASRKGHGCAAGVRTGEAGDGTVALTDVATKTFVDARDRRARFTQGKRRLTHALIEPCNEAPTRPMPMARRGGVRAISS